MRPRSLVWFLALAAMLISTPLLAAQRFNLECRADRYATGALGTRHVFHVPLSAGAPGTDSVDVHFETHLPADWHADWCQKSTSLCFFGNARIRLVEGVSDSLTITVRPPAADANMAYIDLTVRAAADSLDLARCTYTYACGVPLPNVKYAVDCSDNVRWTFPQPGVTRETFITPFSNMGGIDDSLLVVVRRNLPAHWIGEVCVTSTSQCFMDSLMIHLPPGAEDTLQVTMRHYGYTGDGVMDLEIHSGTNPSLVNYCHYQLFYNQQVPLSTPPPSRTGGAWATWAAPNPFRDQATLHLRAPAPTRGALAIFAADGRMVRLLPPLDLPVGETSLKFDGRGSDGTPLPAGVYFYRFQAQAQNLRGILIRTR